MCSYETTGESGREEEIRSYRACTYTVSLKDEDRLYLRLMLLHVRGTTIFESLRKYEGVIHEAFKAAPSERGLLESDDEWDRCLTDASTYQMPRQLRETFAYIICFCHPA